jgi:RHS repeat-associated protein
MINETGVSYQVGFDGTSNVTTITDSSSGAIVALYEYDPFGSVIRSTGSYSDKNQFQYSTKYTEPTVGLTYYGYRYYNASYGRWISRDPSEEKGGINLYGFVNNSPTTFHDQLGLDVLRLLFDAFIHKNLGEWGDEPGPGPNEFRTDFRAFGEFDEKENEGTGNARLWSLAEVESTKIGQLEKGGVIRGFSAAGMSHRRQQIVPLSNWYTKPQSMRAKVNNPDPVIKDVGPCCSTISFKPAAAYPFLPSPDLDYDIVFTLKKLENKKHIEVTLSGVHDQFPYYEALVNKDVFYTFDPQSGGPGPWLLTHSADPIKPSWYNPYTLREN